MTARPGRPDDHRTDARDERGAQRARVMTEALRVAQMGLWEFDVERQVFTFDDQYYRLHGATVQDMGGYEQAAAEFTERWVHPEDRHIVGETTKLAAETSDPGFEIDLEARTRHVDGGYRWVKVWFRVEKDASGRTVRLHGVNQDITARKEAEAAMRWASLVVERSPAVLFRWRAQPGWPVEYVSENVRQFGYTPQELVGGVTPYAALVHPDDLARVAAEVEAHAASGVQRFEQAYRLVTRAGQVRWVEDLTSVERDREGRLTHYQGILLDVTERREAEEALRRSEARFRQVVEAAPIAIGVSDPDGRIGYVNARFVELLGYTKEDLGDVGRWFERAYPDPAYRQQVVARWERGLQAARRDGKPAAPMDVEITCRDGTARPVEVFGAFVGDQLVAIFNDLSERQRAARETERLQGELLQAQKMESVGRLAGGVAHDFNNMLAAILGQVDVMLMGCPPTEPFHEDLLVIQSAALRSAELVRQLLAFARKQTVAPKVLRLDETVGDMLKMLQRLIGEDITIQFRPAPSLWPVRIDPSQVDQVLVNLTVNARDAIQGTGTITIETADVVLDEAYCALHPGFLPGAFVALTVSDDGCGMTKEVLDHLFEPFFTTKRAGRGTGLGLASVYGIVRQNGGFINAYSEPGKGSTFRIYLPRFVGQGGLAAAEMPAEPPRGKGETILLVEDEALILGVTRTLLVQLGYRVLSAGKPGEALALADAHPGEIDLVLTDVVMPEMNGRDLAKALAARSPTLRCLFMSGYSENVIAHHGVLDRGVNFLQKPFTVRSLALAVRGALGD